VVVFEKEYKDTPFYKKTKISLTNIIKGSKAWYSLQLTDIINKIQQAINNLSLENISNIFTQIGDIYATENEETMKIIQEFKTIMK
jgi:hypothetical protein